MFLDENGTERVIIYFEKERERKRKISIERMRLLYTNCVNDKRLNACDGCMVWMK